MQRYTGGNTGKIMGKPEDAASAVRMLSELSGREHQVMTGLATVQGQRKLCGHQLTVVKMRKLSLRVRSTVTLPQSEPQDKASAYGIQGRGAALIEEIKGCYYNVVGLPIALLLEQLASFGIEVL